MQSEIFIKTNIFCYRTRKEHNICIQSIETSKCLQVLKGHTKGITSICFNGRKRIISGGHDNTIRVWDKVVPKQI